MSIMIRIARSATLLLGMGVASFGQGAVDATPRNLTQEIAARRSAVIQNPKYDLDLHLSADQLEYKGRVVVVFDLTKVPQDLFLDFAGGAIQEFRINGKNQDLKVYDGKVLPLKGEELVAGSNRVEVVFRHPYLTTGYGLYRFVDPEDNRVYLYTQFETNYAQTMFPCFDQPDLKGVFTLKATTPESWEVITAVAEAKVERRGKERVWHFPASPRISPYVFSLHAGPYHKWSGKVGSYPSRLFVRQSQKAFVDHEVWFDVTHRGMVFFESYFGIPYPFAKYDQVIAPVLGFSAMENVAAVTFGDKFVYRDKPTRERLMGRASVILHEMAHMWFGNLVTMRWWDDLWLNESFATYMAYLALDAIPEFRGENRIDLAQTKAYSLADDLKGNTHAISLPVPDTESAGVNFDAITYGKGASFLKQMDYYLGGMAFQQGVQIYLKGFSYGNASYQDFRAAMEGAAKKDLKKYWDDWVLKKGANSVAASWKCGDNRLTSFVLTQEAASGDPVLRTHRMALELVKVEEKKVRRIGMWEGNYQWATTELKELNGRECPDLVLLNSGDGDYVKTQMTPEELSKLTRALPGIPDTLNRLNAWTIIFRAVQDGMIPLQSFVALLRDELQREKEEGVLSQLRSYGGESLDWLWVMELSTGSASYRELAQSLQDAIWQRLQKGEKDQEARAWLDRYIDWGDGRTERAVGLLNGHLKVPGVKLGQKDRWRLLHLLARHRHPQTEKLMAREKKDRSYDAQLARLRIAASLADYAGKRKQLAKMGDDSVPRLEQAAILSGLFPREQTADRQRFHQEYAGWYTELLKTKGDPVASRFAGSALNPMWDACDDVALKHWEAQAKTAPTLTRHSLLEGLESIKRCQIIRKAAQSYEKMRKEKT